mmetsp:Transcript_86185/g.230149  ORF Transcript_86185/g.230149 Transcript_86185/m.230149 type:complete len:590 (-) Transcript_86185:400-2169(-)
MTGEDPRGRRVHAVVIDVEPAGLSQGAAVGARRGGAVGAPMSVLPLGGQGQGRHLWLLGLADLIRRREKCLRGEELHASEETLRLSDVVPVPTAEVQGVLVGTSLAVRYLENLATSNVDASAKQGRPRLLAHVAASRAGPPLHALPPPRLVIRRCRRPRVLLLLLLIRVVRVRIGARERREVRELRLVPVVAVLDVAARGPGYFRLGASKSPLHLAELEVGDDVGVGGQPAQLAEDHDRHEHKLAERGEGAREAVVKTRVAHGQPHVAVRRNDLEHNVEDTGARILQAAVLREGNDEQRYAESRGVAEEVVAAEAPPRAARPLVDALGVALGVDVLLAGVHLAHEGRRGDVHEEDVHPKHALVHHAQVDELDARIARRDGLEVADAHQRAFVPVHLHLLAVEVRAEEEEELAKVDEEQDDDEGEVLAAAEEVRRDEAGVGQREAQGLLVEAQRVGEGVEDPHNAAEAHGRGGVARDDEERAPDVDAGLVRVLEEGVGGEGEAAVEEAARGEEGVDPEGGEPAFFGFEGVVVAKCDTVHDKGSYKEPEENMYHHGKDCHAQGPISKFTLLDGLNQRPCNRAVGAHSVIAW